MEQCPRQFEDSFSLIDYSEPNTNDVQQMLAEQDKLMLKELDEMTTFEKKLFFYKIASD